MPPSSPAPHTARTSQTRRCQPGTRAEGNESLSLRNEVYSAGPLNIPKFASYRHLRLSDRVKPGKSCRLWAISGLLVSRQEVPLGFEQLDGHLPNLARRQNRRRQRIEHQRMRSRLLALLDACLGRQVEIRHLAVADVGHLGRE